MNRRRALQSLSFALSGLGLSGCQQSATLAQNAPVWGPAFGRRLINREDPDYEIWRRGSAWQNYKHARYPDVIARPQSVPEVQDCVRFARRNNLKIACRSGGHNVSGAFLRDGGMLLDLSTLRAIRPDPVSQSAWVQPALWSRDMATALSAVGQAFPYAHCATVPMGGYLLGGGIGINGDSWGGIACANITEADVVLASGELVTVNRTEHPELFWSVRGAGTGFSGVVTAYKVRTYPAPRSILSSAYIFSLDDAPYVADWLEQVRRRVPPQTELMLLLANTPNGPAAIARFIAFADDESSARKHLMPYQKAPAASRALAKMEFVPGSLEQSFVESVDATRGLGFGSYAVETVWTNQLSAAMEDLVEHFRIAPSPMTHLLVSPRINDQVPKHAAFSSIGAAFLGTYTVWADPADNHSNLQWHQETTQIMSKRAECRYVNETDGFEAPQRVRSAFSPEAWERLQALRQQYDPTGRFHTFPGWT